MQSQALSDRDILFPCFLIIKNSILFQIYKLGQVIKNERKNGILYLLWKS